VAVASPGPYASLHLAPDREPHQHPTTLVCLQAEFLMGVNATGTLGGRRSSAEDARIEGVGLGRGCAPSQKIYEFFISKLCDMVHSGYVVFY